MSDAAPNAELFRSLARLARGLSALFWGLPAALIACAELVRADSLTPSGIAPALAVNALLLYGLRQMGGFQKQERAWRHALDRARLPAVVNLGLCPFLYWHNKMPDQFFFSVAVLLLVFSAVLFLFALNLVLKQLGAMLPDENLRQETRQFTALNRWLLVAWLAVIALSVLVPQFSDLPARVGAKNWFWIQRGELVVFLFLGLSPLAMTMALLWKAKEAILDSVFSSR
jgi:hypothetical protein